MKKFNKGDIIYHFKVKIFGIYQYQAGDRHWVRYTDQWLQESWDYEYNLIKIPNNISKLLHGLKNLE